MSCNLKSVLVHHWYPVSLKRCSSCFIVAIENGNVGYVLLKASWMTVLRIPLTKKASSTILINTFAGNPNNCFLSAEKDVKYSGIEQLLFSNLDFNDNFIAHSKRI